MYEAMATDNIMDYSHFVKDPVSGNARSPINRFSTMEMAMGNNDKRL